MIQTFTPDDIRKLSVDDRLQLIQTIWESLETEQDRKVPTAAQSKELRRRLADHLSHPEDVVPWEKVKADALARAKK